jgi:hypothetical protein
MKATEEQIIDFINKTQEEWIIYAISRLQKSIKDRKLVASEKLLRSMAHQVVRASAGINAKSVISFEGYGRLRDMKVVTHNSPPPTDVILKEFMEWVKGIGTAKFKYVPGYQRSGKIPSESVAIRRIAWGVAYGLAKKGRHVRKQWYAKKMQGSIINLTERLVTSYQEVIAVSTAQQIQANLK